MHLHITHVVCSAYKTKTLLILLQYIRYVLYSHDMTWGACNIARFLHTYVVCIVVYYVLTTYPPR